MVTTSTTKVLALAYYDGATEGFLNGMGDDQVYFFKVVAWDKNQDQRLFLLVLVDRAIYVELLDILTKSQEVPVDSTWMPVWSFGSPEMQARADNLVVIGKRSLVNPAFLAIGEDLLGTVEIVSLNTLGLASAISLAGASSPVSLADWMAQSFC